MEFDECDYCKAWASTTGTNPEEEEEEEESPRSRTGGGPLLFSVVTHVTFLHLPLDYYDLMDEDDDPPDFLHLVESHMQDVKLDIECHKLTDRRFVEDMLSSMHVPYKPFMVHEILTCAACMLNDSVYANRKVLRMEVQISLYVDELPLGIPIVVSDDEDVDDDDDEDDSETSMVPASKSSIDKLERVEIQESSSQVCSICLEPFSCGFEATCMPCSHLFHGGCIEQWLTKCNSCPLCRFQMS